MGALMPHRTLRTEQEKCGRFLRRVSDEQIASTVQFVTAWGHRRIGGGSPFDGSGTTSAKWAVMVADCIHVASSLLPFDDADIHSPSDGPLGDHPNRRALAART